MSSYMDNKRKMKEHVFVDPDWSNESFRKLTPDGSWCEISADPVEVPCSRYQMYVPGLDEVHGEFTTDKHVDVSVLRWLIMGGKAICRTRVVSISSDQSSLTRYSWVSVGEVYVD